MAPSSKSSGAQGAPSTRLRTPLHGSAPGSREHTAIRLISGRGAIHPQRDGNRVGPVEGRHKKRRRGGTRSGGAICVGRKALKDG